MKSFFLIIKPNHGPSKDSGEGDASKTNRCELFFNHVKSAGLTIDLYNQDWVITHYQSISIDPEFWSEVDIAIWKNVESFVSTNQKRHL